MDWPATALGAASLVVSIVVAWRQQRLARRQEELVERSQASRVWVRFEGFDVARWPDGAPKGFADEEGRRHHSMDGWTCRVFNDSEAPSSRSPWRPSSTAAPRCSRRRVGPQVE